MIQQNPLRYHVHDSQKEYFCLIPPKRYAGRTRMDIPLRGLNMRTHAISSDGMCWAETDVVVAVRGRVVVAPC